MQYFRECRLSDEHRNVLSNKVMYVFVMTTCCTFLFYSSLCESCAFLFSCVQTLNKDFHLSTVLLGYHVWYSYHMPLYQEGSVAIHQNISPMGQTWPFHVIRNEVHRTAVPLLLHTVNPNPNPNNKYWWILQFHHVGSYFLDYPYEWCRHHPSTSIQVLHWIHSPWMEPPGIHGVFWWLQMVTAVLIARGPQSLLQKHLHWFQNYLTLISIFQSTDRGNCRCPVFPSRGKHSRAGTWYACGQTTMTAVVLQQVQCLLHLNPLPSQLRRLLQRDHW